MRHIIKYVDKFGIVIENEKYKKLFEKSKKLYIILKILLDINLKILLDLLCSTGIPKRYILFEYYFLIETRQFQLLLHFIALSSIL